MPPLFINTSPPLLYSADAIASNGLKCSALPHGKQIFVLESSDADFLVEFSPSNVWYQYLSFLQRR
jgi:hypothetical protein